jgi:hypothetical protein
MHYAKLLSAAALMASLVGMSSAQAATCTPGGSTDGLSVTQASSFSTCDGTNGAGTFSPASGYTAIQTDNFSPEVTSGSFTGLAGYSSLELWIQSDQNPPHDDQLWAIFSGTGVSQVNWSFVNGSAQEVSEAVLYGVAATPLPAALPLFAGGLGLLGIVTRRKRKRQAAFAA